MDVGPEWSFFLLLLLFRYSLISRGIMYPDENTLRLVSMSAYKKALLGLGGSMFSPECQLKEEINLYLAQTRPQGKK